MKHLLRYDCAAHRAGAAAGMFHMKHLLRHGCAAQKAPTAGTGREIKHNEQPAAK